MTGIEVLLFKVFHSFGFEITYNIWLLNMKKTCV
jgi:hypothetical protein